MQTYSPEPNRSFYCCLYPKIIHYKVKFNFGFSIQLIAFFQCRKVTLLFTKQNPTVALCLCTIRVSPNISLSHEWQPQTGNQPRASFMSYVLAFSISQYLRWVTWVSFPRQGYNTLDDSDFSTSGESAEISLLSSCFLSSLSCQASQPCALCHASSSQTAGGSQGSWVNPFR